MEENRCSAKVYDRFINSRCTNKAGYGPGKAYCKIHAREKGAVIGNTVTLYRVINDYNGIRVATVEAEDLPKQYVLSGKDGDFEYAKRLFKDSDVLNLDICLTEREAIERFLLRAENNLLRAESDLERATNNFGKALSFAKANGLES